MMIIYFSSISLIEQFYQKENNNYMSNISPVFYTCNQIVKLHLKPDFKETIIELYLTKEIKISPFSDYELNIDLSILVSTNCYLESCQINSVICVTPEIEQYPNLLCIKQAKLINFEDHETTLDKDQPILTLHIYNELKTFKLILAPKVCFKGLYRDFIDIKNPIL